MKIFITNTFQRSAKKLHKNQITKIEETIQKIKNNPDVGELKIGDLAGIRVYKFHILHQLTLLAYLYDEKANEVTLIAFGPHEKFYENLKRIPVAKK